MFTGPAFRSEPCFFLPHLTQRQARSLRSGLWRKRSYRDLCVFASLRSDINALSLYEADSAPILLRGRPHRKVQPTDVPVLLQ